MWFVITITNMVPNIQLSITWLRKNQLICEIINVLKYNEQPQYSSFVYIENLNINLLDASNITFNILWKYLLSSYNCIPFINESTYYCMYYTYFYHIFINNYYNLLNVHTTMVEFFNPRLLFDFNTNKVLKQKNYNLQIHNNNFTYISINL